MNRGNQFQPKVLVTPPAQAVQGNGVGYKVDVPIIQPGPFYAQIVQEEAAKRRATVQPMSPAMMPQQVVAPVVQSVQQGTISRTKADNGRASSHNGAAQAMGSNKGPTAHKGMPRQKLLLSALIGGIVLVVLSVVVGSRLLSKNVPDVTLYKVGTSTVNDAIGGGGIVFPLQQLDLSYPEAERVITVLVKAGDTVKANQALIQLDPSQLNAQVTQAANDLAAAQSYLNTVSANGNALAIAQAQQSYNVAKNKYEALVAEASSPTLHQGILISPMGGVVTTINVNAGEVFSANTPLLTLMDESSVIVHVKVPLADLGQVQVGQSATVVPSALPSLTVTGKVVSVVPKADPQTDTFEVWVEVPNQTMALLPGMSAFVRIQGTQKQAMVLPRLAVLDADHQPTVFVVREDQARLQHVHVIGRSVESIYVDAGIHAGDRVVLVGVDSLSNGQHIHTTRVEGEG